MTQLRKVQYNGGEIQYLLEHKQVKNLNLRIHKDCKVYVSANPVIPAERIDEFVVNKGEYIQSAQKKFAAMALYAPQPKQYVSGETFYILGRGVRLKVEKDVCDSVSADGVYLYLLTKTPEDFARKKRLVNRYLNDKCRTVFQEICEEIYPKFQKYGVSMPTLRIREMETRWGSCLPKKGIITLNKRLLEEPRNCIEYVVTHEYCHFIHPNHSANFYNFLTMLMPDWKKRKQMLDHSVEFGL